MMVLQTKGTSFIYWTLTYMMQLHRRCAHKRVMYIGRLPFEFDVFNVGPLHTLGVHPSHPRGLPFTHRTDKFDEIDTGVHTKEPCTKEDYLLDLMG